MLDDLLEKSLPYLKIEALQKVPLQVMKVFDDPSEHVMEQISNLDDHRITIYFPNIVLHP